MTHQKGSSNVYSYLRGCGKVRIMDAASYKDVKVKTIENRLAFNQHQPSL